MQSVRMEVVPSGTAMQTQFEYVERKGIGHPDTICDGVMEAMAVALAQEYVRTAGRVLHFNVDKGLLVAGQTDPRFGGGRVLEPMRLYVGDRATRAFDGTIIPVGDVIEQAAREWLQTHLPRVDPAKHLIVIDELQPGSAELAAIYAQSTITANDTSVGVGYAPLSETERLVLEAEQFLNSTQVKAELPAIGEDIKVMGVRRDRSLALTVAMALVDAHVASETAYFDCKQQAGELLQDFLSSKMAELDAVEVEINTLDRRGAGAEGVYLTVLGTSAENADSGQVGRGNRVNGLITPCRPMSLEAAAGKNPVSHVGKIYNVLAFHIAQRIVDQVEPVDAASVWLCSRIGYPVDRPWSVTVQVALPPDADAAEIEPLVARVVDERLDHLADLTDQLITQGIPTPATSAT
ncbi:MAG: methionine adenosyltransferase [Planctomycetota bacterium]|nr:MAG: methionine adenosyltransferase [Planctomycetota bacterium]